MKPKLTLWYPPEIKPVRVGVYETYDRQKLGNFYNYFDGESWRWGLPKCSHEMCKNEDVMPDWRCGKWRGLTTGRET